MWHGNLKVVLVSLTGQETGTFLILSVLKKIFPPFPSAEYLVQNVGQDTNFRKDQLQLQFVLVSSCIVSVDV